MASNLELCSPRSGNCRYFRLSASTLPFDVYVISMDGEAERLAAFQKSYEASGAQLLFVAAAAASGARVLLFGCCCRSSRQCRPVCCCCLPPPVGPCSDPPLLCCWRCSRCVAAPWLPRLGFQLCYSTLCCCRRCCCCWPPCSLSPHCTPAPADLSAKNFVRFPAVNGSALDASRLVTPKALEEIQKGRFARVHPGASIVLAICNGGQPGVAQTRQAAVLVTRAATAWVLLLFGRVP